MEGLGSGGQTDGRDNRLQAQPPGKPVCIRIKKTNRVQSDTTALGVAGLYVVSLSYVSDDSMVFGGARNGIILDTFSDKLLVMSPHMFVASTEGLDT